jgi:hypothetical protein
MAPRRVAALATALLAALTTAISAQAASSAATCAVGATGKQGYGYAGHEAIAPAAGIRATITPLSAPSVEDGHVAGWVGVGGPGAGPGGSDQWLQVGVAALPGAETLVYAEITRPGHEPVFRLIEQNLTPGTSRTVSVRELPGRDDWWQASVDGKPVTGAIHLPGLHGQTRPIATAESWDGGSGACNRFSFRFDEVSIVPSASGPWRRFTAGARFRDTGFSVRPLPGAATTRDRTLASEAASFAFLATR